MDLAIDLFAVISVLLIGADIWGLDVGVNLRVDQLFLAVLTVLLFCKNGLVLSKNVHLWAFLVLSLISAVLAFSKFRGFLFFCSILYNVFFVYLFNPNFPGHENQTRIRRRTFHHHSVSAHRLDEPQSAVQRPVHSIHRIFFQCSSPFHIPTERPWRMYSDLLQVGPRLDMRGRYAP